MRYSTIALVVIGVLGASDAALAQRYESADGFVSPAVLSRYGLETAWTAQAVLNPTRDTVAHLVLDEEMVYVQATNGILTAFDAETGRKHWAVRLGRFDEPTFAPVSNEELVLSVVGNSIYAVHKRTGDVLWTLRLPGPPSTSPGVDDKQAYIGMLDGSVYALSLRTIQKLYEQRRLPQWSHQTIAWRYQAPQEITSPPISNGRTVNFASRNGLLFAVTTGRRELTFMFETDEKIVAPIALYGEDQFIASEDYTFYAINAANGKVRWEFVAGLPIRTAPYMVGKNLFLHPDRNGLYCLDATSGVQRWWQPRLTRFVSVASNVMFARNDDLDLVMVNVLDGGIIGRFSASQYPLHIANDRTDRVYVANKSGRVAAIRFSNRQFPIYHKHPELLPLLPEFAPDESASSEMPAGEAPVGEATP